MMSSASRSGADGLSAPVAGQKPEPEPAAARQALPGFTFVLCHPLRPLALRVHEPRAERALGLVLIVRPAQEAQVLDRGLAAPCERLDMVELHVPAPLAAPAALGHERAAPLVALPDLALDGVGEVTAPGGRALLARPVRGAEAALLEGGGHGLEAVRQGVIHLFRRHRPTRQLLEVVDGFTRGLTLW